MTADVLRALEAAIADADREDLPALLGELERLRWAARLRLAAPPPSTNGRPANGRGPRLDRHLTAIEVAERLGTSEKWCYDHQAELGAVKLSGRAVRFPVRAVQRYIDAHRAP